MKKTLSIILAAVMLLSLLSACGGDSAGGDPGKDNAAPPAASSGDAPGGASAPAERKDSWLCDEKTTLTVFTYDRVNNTYEIPSNDLAFWSWLEDYTNVHIEWEISPWVGFEEIISTKLSSGTDLADIVMVKDPLVANNAGKNGLFVNMGDYWDTCFTNTEAYYQSIGFDYRSIFANPDGSLYALDGTVEPVEGHIMLMYNTEWMDKIGAEIPTTIEEFTEVLRKMKAAGDLNGNGDDDEIYLTSSGPTHIVDILGSAFGIEQYEGWDATVADANGVVHDEYTAENMRDCLRYVNSLYSEGLIDQEITSMSMDLLSEKVAADRVGCFIFYSSFAFNYGSLTAAGQADPYGEHYTLGDPLGSSERGTDGYFVYRALADNTSTGVNANCENKELAMKWLDTLLADPNVTQTRIIGFEGKHWEKDASGEPTPILQADGTVLDIAKDGCGQIALPHYQNAQSFMFTMSIALPWYAEQYEHIRSECNWLMPSVPQVAAYTDEELELRDMVATDVTSYWKEMRDKFITGQASLDKDWDSYLSAMDALGLDSYVQVYQSVYERTK